MQAERYSEFRKFYMSVEGCKLDVGAYARALEYACGVQSTIIGKPQRDYFQSAIDDMHLDRNEVCRAMMT